MNARPFLAPLVPFLLAFVLPLLAIFVWWGGFRTVEIREGVAGPYSYAYLEQRGDYSKLPELAGEVAKELAAQKIAAGLPITVLYSNPDLVDVGERVGRAGFLLPPGVQVRPPLRQETIPARPVLVARIQAGSLLAPSKAYAALDEYQQTRGRGIAMPTVEIYAAADTPLRMGVLTVEMPLDGTAGTAPR
ncbi:MAG: GyrI-like domain-containing protein [Pseudomonadota bacterium]